MYKSINDNKLEAVNIIEPFAYCLTSLLKIREPWTELIMQIFRRSTSFLSLSNADPMVSKSFGRLFLFLLPCRGPID